MTVGPVVLFDIDGTLTEPRRKMMPFMVEAICDLSPECFIGLVTGSSVQLITEQLSPLFSAAPSYITENIDLLPCNGTQRYYWDSVVSDVVLANSVSMAGQLGDEDFQCIISEVLKLQNFFASKARSLGITMYGNFVDYRGSLLNWCPIGRRADFDARQIFIDADKEYGIRDELIVMLQDNLKNMSNIVVKYGGQTSFDIFPTGWDKTFCLDDFKDCPIWFVGDSCEEGGNDFEIYNHFSPFGRAFKTQGPQDTLRIINEKILPQIREYSRLDD